MLQDDFQYSHALLGRAVRRVRERKGLSVRELAQAAGISHSQVLRFESGKFDCMAGSFVRMCRALSVPPGWVLDLLVSAEPARFHQAIQSDPGAVVLLESLQIRDKTTAESVLFPLSSACVLASILLRVSSPLRRAGFHSYPNADWKERFLNFATKLEDSNETLDRAAISAELQKRPIATLQRLGLLSRVTLEHRRDDLNLPKASRSNTSFGAELYAVKLDEADVLLGFAEANAKYELTNSSTCSKTPDVKPKDLWPALKRKLQTATEPSGARSALADYLGVELSRVSQWLSDSRKTAREPGAEYALLMQAWLNDPKRAK